MNGKLLIDFGSGYNPKPGFKTCDVTESPFLDYIAIDNKIYDRNFNELKSCSVNKLRCRNTLHHIKDLDTLFKNFYKYINRNGILEIIECSKKYYYANFFLDLLWYRFIIPRKEIWFSSEYRDYSKIAKSCGFKIESMHIDHEKEIITFRKH